VKTQSLSNTIAQSAAVIEKHHNGGGEEERIEEGRGNCDCLFKAVFDEKGIQG